MPPPAQDRPLLRLVDTDALPGALSDALAGGSPIAPLPPTGPERDQAVAMLVPAEPVEDGVAVVVATSGSTGHPKGVLLSAAAISAGATATHERLGGPGDWVLCLPPHYVAGLMVLARAQVAGTLAVRAAPDLSDLAGATGRLGDRRYLSIVPTQLARALDRPELLAALQTFDAVLVGGGPLTAPLARAAEGAAVRVVTSYGMSETCGGCVYDGVPLGGVDVTLEPEPAGRITVGGPVLFSGYRLRPDLTADAVHDGRLVTADRGRWEAHGQQRRLTVLGRVDDVVISGGLNVDLAEVERAVRGWPELAGADLAVVGVPDPEWGTAVAAVVEGPARDAAELSRLRAYLRDRLPAYAAPRTLVGRESLPRTSSGKIDRRQMVADLAPSGSTRTPGAPA